ncbi:MAG TPA: metal-dependent transcriptional regulator [Candidatus Binatia bacterium]|nr:metal-dependent transcriptional regulator [Candidatus Binatia bacterium]
MITVSKEDYLKAILEAECEGEPVIAARLAHWLAVSAPAVTMALRRLKRDRLVAVRKDGRVELTAEGRKIAGQLAMRHHLIERMLHEIFGMAWYQVHDEAERLEHAVSSDFEAMLARKLGRAGRCPHGNPATPESPGVKRKRGLLLLSETQPGSRYAVRSVYERDRRLLEFLEQKGIRPGARLRVHARNYDGTLSLAVESRRVELGGPAADRIWVAKAK